jgi:uncharacterized YigZ family protein
MEKGIFTISCESEVTLEIKRSRFIGRSFKCAIPEEALASVERIREMCREATHNCWAYRIGLSGEQARYHDDREPPGTAGPPILDVLKKNNLTNTLIIVTRYFGGIKLGAGGLARAYRETAESVLEESRPKELRRMKEIKAPVPYHLLAPFENYLLRERYEIIAKDFGESAVIILLIPVEKETDFRSFYLNLVSGKFVYSILGEKYV